MNYLLQDAPKYQMVEQTQPDIVIGIMIITVGMFVLCRLVILIMRLVRKLYG